MTTVTFTELVNSAIDTDERRLINLALKESLESAEPTALAVTEINGGTPATITEDDGTPMTVAAILAEVAAYLGTCPRCGSGPGETCLDLNHLKVGRYVANKHPHREKGR